MSTAKRPASSKQQTVSSAQQAANSRQQAASSKRHAQERRLAGEAVPQNEAAQKEERRRLVDFLQGFARERGARVTFVSGDVHVAAIGCFRRVRKIHPFSEVDS